MTLQHVGSAKTGPFLLVEDDGTSGLQRRHRHALNNHLADEHLAWVLQKLEINCVLDVGANQGQFARRLRQLGFTGRIASFEPVSHALADLRLAAESDPDWFVHPYALGEGDGTVEMNVAPGKGKMSSMLEPSEFGREWSLKLRDTHAETIEIRRLDSVLDEAIERPPESPDPAQAGHPGIRPAGVPRGREEAGGASRPAVGGGVRADLRGHAPDAGADQRVRVRRFRGLGDVPRNRHRKSMRVIEFDVLMVRPDESGLGQRHHAELGGRGEHRRSSVRRARCTRTGR